MDSSRKALNYFFSLEGENTKEGESRGLNQSPSLYLSPKRGITDPKNRSLREVTVKQAFPLVFPRPIPRTCSPEAG